MNFGDIFKKLRKSQEQKEVKTEEKQSYWIKCKKCQSLMYYKEVEKLNYVCPKCNFHMRIGIEDRVKLLADEGTFKEFDSSLAPVDPLNFTDKISYKKRVAKAQEKTGRLSSVVSGECQINGVDVQMVIFDFKFMGGSLGSVEGEKIVRAVTRGVKKKQAVIILSASGGARMQESTFSLLQMSKTSAALRRLSDDNLPFISVLTDPTMGGVSASFASLGDIIIAEPGALIGFAGQRVIKQTIGSELPHGFQRAEFLLEHGLIDMIVQRAKLKKTLSDLITLFIGQEVKEANLLEKKEEMIES